MAAWVVDEDEAEVELTVDEVPYSPGMGVDHIKGLQEECQALRAQLVQVCVHVCGRWIHYSLPILRVLMSMCACLFIA